MMKKQRTFAVTLFVALLLLPAAVFAQSMPIEVEVGYRWTDVTGNEDLYRTQINEREGFLIRSLTMFSNEGTGLFDHFRLDVSELGTAPAGAVRLEAGKEELYRFRLGYRTLDSFSALPAFANPLLGSGIIPGQHTWDRTRTMLDADIEFLPGRRFTPFVGYSLNQFDGPGTTTYTLGGDDFFLGQDLEETDHEFRVGLAFNTSRFSGQVTQGWRSLESEETLTLAPGQNGGNNPGPVLGEPIVADELTRRSETNVDAPFTNLYVTGMVNSRIRVIGDFSQSNAETEGDEFESASGSFLSFAIQRFFTGFEETVASKAENDNWRGGLRGEFEITDKIGFSAGYRTDNRELEGSSLINTLYSDTLNFGGLDPRDVEEILTTENSVDRDEDTLEAALTARVLGPVSLRLGYQQTKQDLVVNPDLSEIVVPGNQGGEFERTINTIDASANFSRAGFTLGAAFRLDDSDEAILRTDYLNRDRIRARASYRTPGNLLRAGITAELVNQENDEGGIGYDGERQNLVGNVEVTPWAPLTIRASYSQIDAESTVNIRRPETLQVVTSFHEEDGEAIEGGLSLALARFFVDLDAARFENEGTLPFSFDRMRARLGFDVVKSAGIIAEWAHDEYEEVPEYGQYEADRFGIFVRYRP